MPEQTAAEALQQLRDICLREYTRASRDPSPDRKVGRKAVLAAEARINSIPTTGARAEFLNAAWHALQELREQYSRDDTGDPDGWGSGAIGAIQNGIDELRDGS